MKLRIVEDKGYFLVQEKWLFLWMTVSIFCTEKTARERCEVLMKKPFVIVEYP